MKDKSKHHGKPLSEQQVCCDTAITFFVMTKTGAILLALASGRQVCRQNPGILYYSSNFIQI